LLCKLTSRFRRQPQQLYIFQFPKTNASSRATGTAIKAIARIATAATTRGGKIIVAIGEAPIDGATMPYPRRI
jgi:hypothetical protein